MKFKAFVAHILSFSMIFTQTVWAFNDIVPPQNIPDNPIDHIVVDPDRAGDTHLDRAQNGTPVVNINSASKGGVSANYYRDFNVNNENLILNNLQGEAGVSNLGGALHGNPNFNKPGGRAADIILNEVTSSRVTNLNGYTEIFGKQAELIIANPNGIMVGGAGFINTSRLSLVTGKSGGLDGGGNLNPFILSENPNAVITVVGRDVVDKNGKPVAYNLGVDMSSGNYVDLLSRVVEINGNILSGGAVNIKTGNDKATRGADGEWTVSSTDKADKPEFAIDSTALGGIYAGRVNIIASEDGVGVRTRGDVIANMDDIKYDARGNILINGENSAARDIKINADKITNSDEIIAKNNIAITANELENTGGQIVAVNDLNLDFSANDWTSSGVFHAGGTLSLAANNFTNVVDDFSGKNITINSIGNITNDGTIKAGNNLSLTSGSSIINGLTLGSDATMHAGGDLNATAATNILNRGFIQALGELSLTTNATINDDYELNPNAQSRPDSESTDLAPEWQTVYDNLESTTDIVVLSDLLNNIKTAEQYYAVQNRLRLVRVEALLNEYAISDDGIDVAAIVASSESELQETLQTLLGENYIASDWMIDLTSATADINSQIDAQQTRADQYNDDAEIAAREQYILDNGDDTGFVYTPMTRAEYATAAGEDYLDFDTMLANAESAAEDDRADKVMQVLVGPAELARDLQTLDWSSMNESDININLSELLGEYYNPSEWEILAYVDSSMDLTNGYLNSLRINSIDRAKVEKTGIHNDGRIYSGGNMSMVSNSVLHNNKGALIYSGGDADFQIKDILFNNENAAGQGIFVNGAMSITGKDGAWLSQLINYDGAIESKGDMTIKATDVINYGSDSIDFSQIDNNIYEAHEYRYYYRECRRVLGTCFYREVNRVVSKTEYDQLKSQGKKVTDKFLYYYVKDYAALSSAYNQNKTQIAGAPSSDSTVKTHVDSPIMKAVSEKSIIRSNGGALSITADNIVNYNSQIAGVDVDIRATNLLNTNLTLNVNAWEYYDQRYRACKSKVLGVCVDYHHPHRYWTTRGVKTISGTSPAQILALNNLNISANKIGNGTAALGDIGISGYMPTAPINQPDTPLQEIVKNGTIDPLANFKKPNGQYGIIRQGDILNGQYLYESDPLLVDLDHYLGSQYFMNRIGVDPFDVESKFMGDAFVEHEIIKDALEQISSFQNQQMTDAERDEYINGLYNALTAEKVADLGLVFGQALSASQIAQLDTDIVWYVRKNITLPNGETVEVLVPQVYLAQSTLNELYGAALARSDVQTSIRGDNVTIGQLTEEADSILNNMGAIVGNRELVISTDELNNAAMSVGGQRPVLKGGDLLTINTGTLNNISGQITGGDVNITADELNNITLTQTESLDRGDYKRTETHIGGTAEISATGDMNITTTGDVNMAGSTIASGGDMDLNIGGDLNALAIQDYEYEYEKQSSGDMLSKRTTTNISESVTNIGSEISSGGNMNIDVGDDATFAGATINAGGNADLEVGGDTIITAVVDSKYSYHNTDKSSWGGLVSEKHIVEDAATRLAGSELNVRDGLTINTGSNLNLIASDVNVGGDANIAAGNNINILSADEMSSHYELHEKTNYLEDLAKAIGEMALAVGTGGASLLVVNDSFDAGCSGGSCGVNVTIGSSEKDENTTRNTTAIGSSINVGGDLSMDAENDINIRGSDVNVGGDGSVTAGNNINILESQNTSESSSSHEDTKITAGASVGNSYVDAGFAADGLVKAGELVKSATDALDEMKELHAAGKASDEAVRDAELNLAMATANLANAELALVSSIAGAAAAASTSFGTGMYAAGSVNYETNKNSSSASSTTSNASNIFGNNVTLTSGNDMLQSGSNVGANENLTYNIENDLNVISSTDTYETKSSSDSFNASVSVGNNGVSVNAGYNESENRGRSTTNNNSNVIADNIVINTGNDATFGGANVNADADLTMKIGGDLTVESKQDTDYAKGNNWGVNGGIGTNGNVSAGFNVGGSNHDSAWVNDQTDLTSGNVNINVDGKTTITGGMIAAVDENGNDTGNLNLSTNELEYNDVKDFNISEESGFGVSTSFGKSNDKGEWNAHPSGTTTVSMTDKGNETEQTTHATIGSGNISVGGTELAKNDSSFAGLNRDIDNAQETTKDMITGALDGSVTIDNRILTEEGRAQIIDQHENLAENIEQIGDGLRNNIVVKSVENAVTDDTKSIIDTVGDYIEQDRQMTEMQEKQRALVDAVNGLTNLSPEQMEAAAQDIANFVAGMDGFTGDISLSNVEGSVVGFAYKSDDGTVRNINLNLANIDMTDPNAVMNAIYHETTNFDQHTANEQTAKNRGDTGAGIFDLKNYGNENTNNITSTDWLDKNNNSSTITNGNNNFVQDIINGANGTGKTNYSTYGDLNIDGTKLTITAVNPDDESRAIIDNATGIIIGTSKDVDTFIMIDPVTGEIVKTKSENGAAVGNVIHVGMDITEYMNQKLDQADNEWAPVVGIKSMRNGEYDFKNTLIDDFGIKRDGVSRNDHHYDGYLYYGDYDSGRGVGNEAFGGNAQNLSYVPNSFSFWLADVNQSIEHAPKAIKNTTFDDILNLNLPKLWYPETKKIKGFYQDGVEREKQRQEQKGNL